MAFARSAKPVMEVLFLKPYLEVNTMTNGMKRTIGGVAMLGLATAQITAGAIGIVSAVTYTGTKQVMKLNLKLANSIERWATAEEVEEF